MNKKSLSTLAALCIALLTPAALPTQAQTATTATTSSSSARVIVKYKADSTLLRKQALSAAERHAGQAQALGARVGMALSTGAGVGERTHVVFASGISSEALAARLARESDIEYAIPDVRKRRFAAPNDPRYASGGTNGPAVGQWYLRAPQGAVATTQSTLVATINAEAAWDVTIGNPSVVVAVLDTGVRFDHPDLKTVVAGGNLLDGYDMVHDVDIGNDGGGRDADASDPGDWITAAEANNASGPFSSAAFGCTELNPTTGLYVAADSSWHGTQTAGLVGALTGNGVGMASVGRTVRVLPVRVLGKCGGFNSDIAAGMLWAAGIHIDGVPDNPNPAKVINLSLGGPTACSSPFEQSIREAVAEVLARGVVVVASAGNSAGHAVGSPADCSGVIAVGGLRHIGTKVGYSDLGSAVTLSAPAGNCFNTSGACLYPILTTLNTGTTVPVSNAAGGSTYSDGFNPSVGTSFSAPLVAGTAALMASAQPSLTPSAISTLLRSTARPFPSSGAGTGTPQCTAPQYDSMGNPVDQNECYCTAGTCGAGMLDAAAAVAAAAVVQAAIGINPAAPEAGSPITFSAEQSTAASGRSIASYRWSVTDNGGIVTGFAGATDGLTAFITPSAAGRFTVDLTVTDSTGASSTVARSVDVAAVVVPATGDGGGGALGLGWLLALVVAVLALSRTGRRRTHG